MAATVLALVVSAGLLIVPGLLLFVWTALVRKTHRSRVTVLVLGDVGRSPRMQYHVLSLIQNGFSVDLVGYRGADPLAQISSSPHVTLWYLPQPPKMDASGSRALYLLKGVQRSAVQFLRILGLLLFVVPKPGHILIQNPPAIPTLAIAQIVRLLNRSRLIIDWHNLGYSIMAISLGETNKMVKIAKIYERLLGCSADAHLCVTKAMASLVQQNWHASGDCVVLYDKAPSNFHRLSLDEIHNFLLKLDFSQNEMQYRCEPSASLSTLLTAKQQPSSPAFSRPDRPALIVSSTSWTEDEDFSILADAIQAYDRQAVARASRADQPLPRLFIVITGKGALKEPFMASINEMDLQFVTVKTAWLKMEDYPMLLGCADLGVSLHYSSSGLDLPMKVVDMFGCSLPACSIGYQCIDELIRHKKNGLIFESAEELSSQWIELLEGFPHKTDRIDELRQGIRELSQDRWSDNWDKHAKDLFASRR
ncbi:uncharacterized protein BJ171DRAFT_419412 [Polychytrium aggregatum]|uniref:uncharacterized protein n=1 Tax=Polychytrium aggregatum TaxID=110093 RepID=UPI0022FE60F0|nr:uncharacterized protein BJ171DRAFT_419412 [Polychytrium aggregatum]KAI9208656.1 hypothetical protein BJ171DRAFT_419412 [Polychytrium aggregatum]